MTGIMECGYWGPGKPWRRLPIHTNPGLEIVLITKGEFTWEVEGRAETIRPGTVFFTLPQQRHGAGERPHPGVELYFVILNPAQLSLPAADRRWITQTLERAERHAFPATALVRQLMPVIVRELTGQAPGRAAVVPGLLGAVLVELARTVAAQPEPVRSDASAAVRQFTRQLERRLDEVWTLDAMARACGLKRTQFAARFTELTGDTPMTYLNRMRIRRAEALLAKGDRSITEIAHACGFQSSQYFATVFRQFTRTAPSARRRAEV
jgi:AraC family L-rhamnose operon regulatory protein RhaS